MVDNEWKKKSISELNPQADQHHSDLHQPSQQFQT